MTGLWLPREILTNPLSASAHMYPLLISGWTRPQLTHRWSAIGKKLTHQLWSAAIVEILATVIETSCLLNNDCEEMGRGSPFAA